MYSICYIMVFLRPLMELGYKGLNEPVYGVYALHAIKALT